MSRTDPELKAQVQLVENWLDGGCNSWGVPMGAIRKIIEAVRPSDTGITPDAVEAVARAICIEDTVGLALSEVTPTERDHYFAIARAAIAATRAPSALLEGLKEAAFLCARVRDLEGALGDAEQMTDDYLGHVVPSLARLEGLLTVLEAHHVRT